MHWVLAGLIAGLVAWVVDYVMWGQVFTKGMDHLATPGDLKARMPAMMVKSATLALGWGVLFAFLYRHFMNSLWVPPGALGAMEFATTLWLGTIVFVNVGSGVWYDKARPLLNAQIWAWLARMNAAAIVVGLLVHA